ncbi:MAG: antibiotic biosynthesis monooxygenase [Candidatus Devosia euplotis]|nr:antibiotic biosynthesis monooxygenase [Candidatus Devosia euplotis]
MPDHIGMTRAEPGCLSFEVSQDPATPGRFLVWEIFADQAAFERHQALTKASVWAEITAGLNRHYTISRDSGDQPDPTHSPQGHQQQPDIAGGERFCVPDVVRRRAVSEGQQGLDWLAELDVVLAGLEQNWEITIGPTLAGGTTAFVAQAITATGEPVILKVSTPATDAGRHEADVLGHAAGKGYVQLLRHDPSRRAMLLECLGDRLDTLDLPYQRQVDILFATLLQAWMPVPAGFQGLTGSDKANSLAQAILRLWSGAGQPCAQIVIDTALMYCHDRAAAYRPESAVLAHGDPHPANILAVPDSDPIRFKFIDPDGLAIEPAYDLDVLLRAWHDGIADGHAHYIAPSHARHLTTRTQVPSEAIWQWGYIERISTGLHLLEIGEAEKGQTFLKTAKVIASTAG